ncbi:MAG: SulP family inorganic anion transporter [Planctomycetes bacterium]|nr:SulP family inorganic anion transporter [Planctomycetota bacterium]
MRALRSDLPAALVVFLVALPLCLGIAVASGAPPISGLIAGAVGGIIVGLASGSPLGVSGPAAGLTSIVLVAIQQVGSYEKVLAAIMIAGLLQIALGFLRAGVIAYYFPSAVIKGMLAGIGVIIVLKQLPHAIGYDKDPIGEMGFVQPDQHNTFSELYYMLLEPTAGAIVIALACLAVLLIWERPLVQGHRLLKLVPGPFLAVLVGVLLAQVFRGIDALAIGPGHYVDLRELASYPRPDFEALLSIEIWTLGLSLAIVASLESLLCVEATDRMDPLKRITPTNRELHAQGLGNVVSGFLGGLPVTQVVVRSSANVQAGARTKLSTIAHGGLLIAAVLAIPGVLSAIPLASLAAVLLVVGWKLAKPALWVAMWKAGKVQFALFAVTVLGVAFIDLLKGVSLGLAVAVVCILWKNYKTPFQYDPRRAKPGMPIYLVLSQDVTFLNKASIMRTLNELPDGARVVIDASRSVDIDPDVREIIENFAQAAPLRRIRVELLDFPMSDEDQLQQMTVLGGRPRSRAKSRAAASH